MLRRFHEWLYPELKLFDNLDARQQAEERIKAFTIRSPRLWIGTLALCVPAVFLTVYINSLWRGHWFALVVQQLTIVSFGAAGGMFFTPHKKIRRELRRVLSLRGVRICIPCSYNLTGVESPRCPECGQAFDAKIGDEATTGTS